MWKSLKIKFSSFLVRGGFGIEFYNLGIFFPGIGDFYRRDWGFFNLGLFFNLVIFIPQDREYFQICWFIPGIADFFPRDLGFLKIWGFLSPSPGDICEIHRIFLGWGFFFVGWDIPPKSHLCFLVIFEEWLKIGNQLSRVNFFQSKEFFVKILISIIGVKMQCPKNRFYGLWSSRRSPVGVHTFEGFQKLHD